MTMTDLSVRAAGVRVPGSTSNLGAGFDTIGLALDRHLHATFTPDDSGALSLERRGTLVRLEGMPGPDLVAETFRDGLAAEGVVASGHLLLTSNIPVVRGFGSSAAAILAGYDLARAALGLEPDPDACFSAAYAHEGHGDNAGPSLYGGLRAVVRGTDGPRVLPLELDPAVGFAYAAPAATLSTKAARAALPATVPHAVAIGELGRLAALMHGLASGDPELIRIGFQDDLHVPYRLPLIHFATEAVAAGYAAGAWGVTISGGGSGLIAACALEDAPRVADAMRQVFAVEDDGPECVGFEVRPDFEGLRRE